MPFLTDAHVSKSHLFSLNESCLSEVLIIHRGLAHVSLCSTAFPERTEGLLTCSFFLPSAGLFSSETKQNSALQGFITYCCHIICSNWEYSFNFPIIASIFVDLILEV
uniref:Uncharacterized protein n=1 Tax=Opuntia streptacantha TaxID=393608 RepID=A0A7C8Z1S6_OPUST